MLLHRDYLDCETRGLGSGKKSKCEKEGFPKRGSGLGKMKVQTLLAGKIPEEEKDPGDQASRWKQMPLSAQGPWPLTARRGGCEQRHSMN